MKKRYLISTTTCRKCDGCQTELENNGIEFTRLNADVDELGMQIAETLEIFNVPAFVFELENGDLFLTDYQTFIKKF